jgi:hypothetical protein
MVTFADWPVMRQSSESSAGSNPGSGKLGGTQDDVVELGYSVHPVWAFTSEVIATSNAKNKTLIVFFMGVVFCF